MNAQADYQRVIDLLSKQHLAPYVSYAVNDSIRGLHDKTNAGRVVVRVADGKIVSGKEHIDIEDGDDAADTKNTNPVSHPLFDVTCYRATGEHPTTFDGSAALAIDLAPTCSSAHSNPFTQVIVDPRSFRPLDATGTAQEGDRDARPVTLRFDQRFAAFSGRWMPAAMTVDVTGNGFMFWLQVHVHEVYSDYQFMNSP